MGIKGRGAVLRSVSQTIGLDGDKVVPSDDELAEEAGSAGRAGADKAINERVDKGIQAGVEQGVQKITSELTAGFLASQAQFPDEGQEMGPGGPEGAPAPPGGPGMGPGPGSGGPGMGGMDRMARQTQGSQPTPMSRQLAQPATVVGNQRLPPGPGGRMPPIGGGPG